MSNIKIGDKVQAISIQGIEVKGTLTQMGRVFPIAIVKVDNGDRLDIHECYSEDLKLVK